MKYEPSKYKDSRCYLEEARFLLRSVIRIIGECVEVRFALFEVLILPEGEL